MTTSLAWGRATARARMRPSFLIVGAQRCGTTSLYRALVQHPAVLRPPLRKGIHYFDTGYDRGPQWYRAHFPLTATARLVASRVGHPVMTFESSPYYMFHPLSPERIARDLPDVKLLVLVRDPVERAYSAHAHESARGFENQPFDLALELEASRLEGEEQRLREHPFAYSHAHQHNAYATRGNYVDQIMRLEALVGRDRLHVTDSDDFFADPMPSYTRVLDFLGLSNGTPVRFDKHNARPRSPMAESLRRRLRGDFELSDAKLADWLGAVPSWRR